MSEEKYEYDNILNDINIQLHNEQQLRQQFETHDKGYRKSLEREEALLKHKKELIDQYKDLVTDDLKFQVFSRNVHIINDLVDKNIEELDIAITKYENELNEYDKDSIEYEAYSKLLDGLLERKVETLKRGNRLIQREFNKLAEIQGSD